MGYIGAGISRFNTADELTVTGDATIDTTTLVVDSTNNRVGIGIAAPSEELEISGTGVQTLKVDRTDASTAGALTINSANGSNYIYNLTAKKLIFGTNNTGGLTIDENNKIGIGTTAPAHNVEIVATAAGSVNDSLQIRNNATSSGTGSRIRFINSTDANSDTNGASISSVRNGDDNDLVFETENATRMTIDHAGNVGIGTSSVDNKLHLENAGSLYLQIENTSTANKFYVGNSSGSAILESTGSYSMNFKTNSTERMRLDASGNLLVGKTADNVATVGIEARATGPLISTRDGSDALRLNRLNSDGEIIQLRKDGTTVGSIGVVNTNNPFISNDADNSGLQFASTSILPHYDSLQRDNAVDLGSSSVRFKDGYFNGSVFTTYVKGNGGHTGQVHFTGSHDIRFVTNGSERARFDDSANFLVGATSLNDTNGFTVFPTGSGSATMVRIDRNSNGSALQFRQGQSAIGTVTTTTSGVTYNTTSDRRLKQDIEPLEATDKLMAMNPVSYAWKADPDGPRSMGFIAQEMQEVMPEAVSTGEDDDVMMSMDYGRITPILVSALQDAHHKIDELAAEIAELKAN